MIFIVIKPQCSVGKYQPFPGQASCLWATTCVNSYEFTSPTTTTDRSCKPYEQLPSFPEFPEQYIIPSSVPVGTTVLSFAATPAAGRIIKFYSFQGGSDYFNISTTPTGAKVILIFTYIFLVSF